MYRSKSILPRVNLTFVFRRIVTLSRPIYSHRPRFAVVHIIMRCGQEIFFFRFFAAEKFKVKHFVRCISVCRIQPQPFFFFLRNYYLEFSPKYSKFSIYSVVMFCTTLGRIIRACLRYKTVKQFGLSQYKYILYCYARFVSRFCICSFTFVRAEKHETNLLV